ncbi:MAG: T9SS type A sorting domain-containing protein [Hymenobacteraceae bacterium]|nr:T9SS type A sorting domain-containing protein [Hymenobacteraceae bacterium]
MRLLRTLLTATALGLAAPAAWAQCAFTPTVTPDNLILCPNTRDTLRTQIYDAYQWLKEGQPIAGATGSTYVVEQFRDAGSQFSVRATRTGCTATSAQVLVDGWLFAGLTVMSSGSFGVDPLDGHAVLCDSNALHPRDTVHFEVLPPFTSNVQWSRDGQPIAGATNPRLTVTASGTYSVVGSPEVCTGYHQNSLPLEVELRQPSVLTITLVNDRLVATGPAGVTLSGFSWFRNGVAVLGATASTLAPRGAGLYRVQADDGMCWSVSALFSYTPMGLANESASRVRLAPNPFSTELLIEAPTGAELTLRDLTGRLVLRHPVTPRPADVRALPAGLYLATVTDASGHPLRTLKMVKE